MQQHGNQIPEPSQKWGLFGDIGVYGISFQGSSHAAGGVPCQDNNMFCYLEPEGILIAAVADGVGSCEMSHWGAAAATGSAVTAIAKQLRSLSGETPLTLDQLSAEAVEKLFHNAFRYALKKVNQLAAEQEREPSLYQTTLTAAVYDGSRLACCHVGDGGVVAQGSSGNYRLITERMKGEEANSVVPLQSGRWQITVISTQITGFLMATDGVLDHFVSGKALGNRVYYPFFAEQIYGMASPTEEQREQSVENAFRKTYESVRTEDFTRAVTDDITLLAVANQKLLQTGVRPQFSGEDWEAESRRFLEEKKQKLYPGHIAQEAAHGGPSVPKTAEGLRQQGGGNPSRRKHRQSAPAQEQNAPRQPGGFLFRRARNAKLPDSGENVPERSEKTVEYICRDCGLRILADRQKHPRAIRGDCPYCGGTFIQKRRDQL